MEHTDWSIIWYISSALTRRLRLFVQYLIFLLCRKVYQLMMKQSGDDGSERKESTKSGMKAWAASSFSQVKGKCSDFRNSMARSAVFLQAKETFSVFGNSTARSPVSQNPATSSRNQLRSDTSASVPVENLRSNVFSAIVGTGSSSMLQGHQKAMVENSQTLAEKVALIEPTGFSTSARWQLSSTTKQHFYGDSCDPKQDSGATGYIGLRNEGNTCYLNALLQCLYFTPEFSQRFFTKVVNYRTFTAVKNIFLCLNNHLEVTTRDLRHCLLLEGSEQQDVPEIFQLLLNKLDEEPSGGPSFKEIYESTLVSLMECQICGGKDGYQTGCNIVILPLAVSSSCSPMEPWSVDKAMAQFQSTKEMTEEDKVYCDVCEDKTDTKLTQTFTRLPPVLVVQLKRFDYSFRMNRYEKLNDEIVIGSTLEVKCEINKQPEVMSYELFAICDHHGGSWGGHYTALIKPKDHDKWYYFNDRRVETVLLQQKSEGSHHKTSDHDDHDLSSQLNTMDADILNLRSRTAYLLMYRQKSVSTQEGNEGGAIHADPSPPKPSGQLQIHQKPQDNVKAEGSSRAQTSWDDPKDEFSCSAQTHQDGQKFESASNTKTPQDETKSEPFSKMQMSQDDLNAEQALKIQTPHYELMADSSHNTHSQKGEPNKPTLRDDLKDHPSPNMQTNCNYPSSPLIPKIQKHQNDPETETSFNTQTPEGDLEVEPSLNKQTLQGNLKAGPSHIVHTHEGYLKNAPAPYMKTPQDGLNAEQPNTPTPHDESNSEPVPNMQASLVQLNAQSDPYAKTSQDDTKAESVLDMQTTQYDPLLKPSPYTHQPHDDLNVEPSSNPYSYPHDLKAESSPNMQMYQDDLKTALASNLHQHQDDPEPESSPKHAETSG